MATISVKIYPEEKDKVVDAIKRQRDKTVSVAAIAKAAGFNPNRTRFIIDELLEEGRIKRVPTKVFNPRYIRYSYEVISK
jgi:DNA-binding Lrp family transcriptional regulator